jgi:hypothetical protein
MTTTSPITDAPFSAARRLIESNGGTIAPDNSFEIYGAEGHFQHDGDSPTIAVTKSLFLASWKRSSHPEQVFG